MNAFLKDIAGSDISLKDFRTLCATAEVLQALSGQTPASSAAGRKRQVTAALRSAADTLENTVSVCRKSYVHPAIIAAFEAGALRNNAPRGKDAVATLIKDYARGAKFRSP